MLPRTPSMTVSWQFHEAVKALLGEEKNMLRKKILYLNAFNGSVDIINLSKTEKEVGSD